MRIETQIGTCRIPNRFGITRLQSRVRIETRPILPATRSARASPGCKAGCGLKPWHRSGEPPRTRCITRLQSRVRIETDQKPRRPEVRSRITRLQSRVRIETSTTAQEVSQRQSAVLFAVRVGGTANLVGTITLAESSTGNVKETIPAAATPGTAREHYGATFSGIRVTLSNVADTAIVIWGSA